MRHISTSERCALLADRHRLTPALRTDDVVAITDALVALHSSDPATVFLSAFARMSNPRHEVVEAALYDDRSLLRHHAMRRTLWIATPELTAAMNASSSRKVAAAERKKLLKALAMTAGAGDPETELEHLTSELMAFVRSNEPITTREIGKRRPDLARKISVGAGKHTVDVSAHGRVASLAGFDAKLIRGRPSGSWIGSEYAWHIADDWTDADFDAVDERAGAATVLREWLSRFGPGTETDLRWWTGWTATMVRGALADIEAVEVSLDDDSTGWMLPDDPVLDTGSFAANAEPWVALLPGLDPTTMGWKERSWYLDGAVTARVFDRNGNAGPTIWRSGQVVGGWIQRPSGDLALDLVHELSTDELALLEVEVERMRVAIGDTRFRVRFPSPNQKELLA